MTAAASGGEQPGVALRDDLTELVGYHSAQVDAPVRLNTNESPFAPPDAWRQALAAEVARMDFHRYPDRHATALRQALADRHGVDPAEVFCANGSNEVLQCLLLAYGGPGRRAILFEPTYALHSHISHLTGTEVVAGPRDDQFLIDVDVARRLQAETSPVITFVCSPNNPTGRTEPEEVVSGLLADAPGLLVVDEAYGQFARASALSLRRGTAGVGMGPHASAEGGAPAPPGPASTGGAPAPPGPDHTARLVVVRTFSKTWSMAGVRLGYLVAHPEVVAACEATALPYHLSSLTQVAGVLALEHQAEMEARVATIAGERGRLSAGLAELDVESWPSEANFILFRPRARSATAVWQDLVDQGVLVRDCSSWTGLHECLRVTVGTPEENGSFLKALARCLR